MAVRDICTAVEATIRGGSTARVRIVKAHQAVRPSGANHGALILALPAALEAVVAAGAAPDYGAALEFVAERSEAWAKSPLATTTPKQYRPSMKTWLAERLLDDPAAWRETYDGAGKVRPAPTLAEAEARLERVRALPAGTAMRGKMIDEAEREVAAARKNI